MRSRLLVLFTLLLGHAASAETPAETFEKVWTQARANIYPQSLAETHFTNERYTQLRTEAENAKDLYALTPIINNFLQTLNVSHTHFYDNHSVDYYFFRSLFGTRDLAKPMVKHIGAQFESLDGNYVIREVLDGYPAANAGLRRGDIIATADGKPFHPYKSANTEAETIQLGVQRNGDTLTIPLVPIAENPNRSLYRALQMSAKRLQHNGKSIGYVRLWSGTTKRALDSFESIIKRAYKNQDAIIFDLRGGYGGAWYEYLDPFFADRSEYFKFSVANREGKETFDADEKTKEGFYAGPLVVLINEGTRSGKESLAYFFKKSGRAKLVGATTAGAFSAGRGIFNEEETPYFLYLSVAEYFLDGNKVEGVGIEPDVAVAYPLTESLATDPQLESALQLASEL